MVVFTSARHECVLFVHLQAARRLSWRLLVRPECWAFVVIVTLYQFAVWLRLLGVVVRCGLTWHNRATWVKSPRVDATGQQARTQREST